MIRKKFERPVSYKCLQVFILPALQLRLIICCDAPFNFVILFSLYNKTLFLNSEKFQTTAKTQKKFISYWKKSRDRCFANRHAARQDLS